MVEKNKQTNKHAMPSGLRPEIESGTIVVYIKVLRQTDRRRTQSDDNRSHVNFY